MIGRAKTVIVYDDIGIVTEIVVQTSPQDKPDRLTFRGPANFKTDTKQHLRSIILPIVDKISDNLNIPERDFEISAVNLGATASADIGIEISGFSADLPVLLSLLSVSLKIPLQKDVVSTGHVASIAGDLAPVRSIPAKLGAAVSFPGISTFVLPDLEREKSLQILAPIEFQAAKNSLLRYKGDIKIHHIGGIQDAVRIFMPDESVVIGSLEAGFYNVKETANDSEDPVNKTVAFFSEDNEKRFWDVLGHSFLNRSVQKSKRYLQTYIAFHIRNQFYPKAFGEQLIRLVISLPPAICRLDNLFPLFSMELYIKLAQYAKNSDYEDIRQLYKAVFGESFGEIFHQMNKNGKIKIHEDDFGNELLGRLLAELSEENLAKKVELPVSKARSNYITNEVTVQDGFEFNAAITAFSAHMFRHIDSLANHIKPNVFSAEAIYLVTKAFEREGGYKAALAEAKYGVNGGMRFVFDTITDYLKDEQKEKYISKVFKDVIDPLDWDAKVQLMEVFMERIKPELPSDLKDMPAKKLASHWEEIIRDHVKFKTKVTELIKRL